MKWTLLVLFAIACGGKATSTGPVNKGGPPEGDPYALAVVVQGWELWMGNDDLIKDDDPSYYKGALKSIKAAFEKSTFVKSAPGGSQAMLVTYADRANIRVPMGPIAKLDAAAFGVQKDYYSKMGSELVLGITTAVAELDKLTVPKKFLIVLGDGNDTNNEAAAPRLAKLKDELALHHIEVISLVLKTQLSAESTVVTKLSDGSTVSGIDALGTQLQTALDHLAKR